MNIISVLYLKKFLSRSFVGFRIGLTFPGKLVRSE